MELRTWTGFGGMRLMGIAALGHQPGHRQAGPATSDRLRGPTIDRPGRTGGRDLTFRSAATGLVAIIEGVRWAAASSWPLPAHAGCIQIPIDGRAHGRDVECVLSMSCRASCHQDVADRTFSR